MNIHILEVQYETHSTHVFATPNEELFLEKVAILRRLNQTRVEGWLAAMCTVANHYFLADIKDFRTFSVQAIYAPLHLSPREKQIAEEITKGTQNQEIAALLNLSVKTVATYRERLKEKLGVKSNAEIALKMREHGHA
jgi:DNA-binding NarL/FixJ family response regulator